MKVKCAGFVILTSEQIERWLSYSDDDEKVIATYGLGREDRLTAYRVHRFGFGDNGRQLIERRAASG